MSELEHMGDSKPTLTRGKLMLLFTLGSTLISVLWTQFSGEDEPKPAKGAKAAHAPAKPGPAVASTSRTPAPAQAATKQEAKGFPKIEREETLQHDPFALSDAFAKKLAAAANAQGADGGAEALRKQEEQKKHQTLRQQALNKLLEQGVAVVVRGDNGPAATIGSRLVHEGDVIDGFRVDKIDSEGVILKEAPLP